MKYDRDHSDSVADRAIGRVSNEWKYMAKIAVAIRKNNANPVWIDEQTKRFTGIYKRLLTDPLEEVEREAGM